MKTKLALLALTVALAGCVAGQNIKLHYEPAPGAAAGPSVPVTLRVIEQRDYVTRGDKSPAYLGHYRAGFGNTWDVINRDKVPLADQMRDDLRAELASLGCSDAAGGKVLTVTIHEWNFDAWVNGKIWFDVEASLAGADGTPLASSHAKEERPITGSFWSGGKGAMEKNVPEVYGEVLRKLVREDPAMMAALRR